METNFSNIQLLTYWRRRIQTLHVYGFEMTNYSNTRESNACQVILGLYSRRRPWPRPLALKLSINKLVSSHCWIIGLKYNSHLNIWIECICCWRNKKWKKSKLFTWKVKRQKWLFVILRGCRCCKTLREFKTRSISAKSKLPAFRLETALPETLRSDLWCQHFAITPKIGFRT